MKIKFITTGGTIDKIYFDQKNTYQVGESQIEQFLKQINVHFDLEMHSLLKKDSLEMTEEDRQLIYDTVVQEKNRYIILTHGTDTMVNTARKLITIPDKVIVLTGAMQPARFKETDAIFNIGCAIAAVQTASNGVYITMNGRVFPADQVRKNVELGKFEEI